MGKIKLVILAAIFVVTAMHESMGFVRVGRAEERNRGRSPLDEVPYEESGVESERGIESEAERSIQRRVVDQLALMKFLIDAYNKRDKERLPYVVISKRGNDRPRNMKERLSTLLHGKTTKWLYEGVPVQILENLHDFVWPERNINHIFYSNLINFISDLLGHKRA